MLSIALVPGGLLLTASDALADDKHRYERDDKDRHGDNKHHKKRHHRDKHNDGDSRDDDGYSGHDRKHDRDHKRGDKHHRNRDRHQQDDDRDDDRSDDSSGYGASTGYHDHSYAHQRRRASRRGPRVDVHLPVGDNASVDVSIGAGGPRVALRYGRACGRCHVAFAPDLLTRGSWQRLIGGLDSHFGATLNLGWQERDDLLRYLVGGAYDAGRIQRGSSAGRSRHIAPTRVTRTRSFRRAHRVVPSQFYRDHPNNGLNRCEQCHRDAAQGRYRLTNIVIPGMGPWSNRR